jgi:hypothetical protein
MTQNNEKLDLCFDDCILGISSRRIWEHMKLRQINPFTLITQTNALKPQKFVDIIDLSSPIKTLTGLVLSDLLKGNHNNLSHDSCERLLEHIQTEPIQIWLTNLEQHLYQFSKQDFTRNIPKPFLPIPKTNPLGISGLHCALDTWLKAHRTEKGDVGQWLHRIKNLAKRGLRAEELTMCFREEDVIREKGKSIKGSELAVNLSYKTLSLSILPMLEKASSQLTFLKVPANTKLKRIKPKLKSSGVTQPQWRDPVLGYWVDVVNWDDLLRDQRGWMAFTHRGEPITSHHYPTGLCFKVEDAWELANNHAKIKFPKLTSVGMWTAYRLTGGEKYTEWLVTLPHYKPSFFSDHYPHRNVLLHIRCDLRELATGERALVLQEVQSDWAQQARRIMKDGNDMSELTPVPPWLQEWPALALKLMLLHAVKNRITALVWTKGDVQIDRYDGLGREGLLELYDHTMPKELERILRPHGIKCENIDVYTPVNYYIDPVEIGYEVSDEEGNYLGTTATWDEAQKLLPDGAHELLTPMHGVKIDRTLRQEILTNGFYAWGSGIK